MDNLRQLVEAFIFASDSPLSLDRLSILLEQPRAEIKPVVEQLQQQYAASEGGFYLAEVAGGYQFRTMEALAPWLRKLSKDRAARFSRAALETLAIIAYRQPVTRAEIEYLRGVDSGGVMKTLLDKNLLRILGKKDVPGRPLIYGTSRQFLELFGLRDLSDLPTLKEFSALDPELIKADPLDPDRVESS
ncbi:MAG: SMC-Scp complex subunit ScpB [Thermodesulfobacteriota bacterium]|nr:SMC-Scp complex subunit ScpB [Thermodesulfobacteriota bacterium]